MMALRIRFQYPTGASLGYSIERLVDGHFLDFVDATFRAVPNIPVAALPEDTGSFRGRYKLTNSTTPVDQFRDGAYAVTIHDRSSNDLVVGQLSLSMRNGDDSSLSEQSTPQVDPWSVILPGSYPPGSAGAIIAENLDAAISTRSTYSGGPVQGVLSPVTVGSCLDKSGYRLAADGFDEIVIEPGINARQSLSPILAGIAGDLSGAGSGTIVIKAGGNSATRIIATTDNSGNRSSVSMNLPL